MAELEAAPGTARELLFGDSWEYAPAPQSADHVRLDDRYGAFVDGQFRDADEYFPSINPATEETIAEVGLADE
ncbi:MAG: betaine-aldehyde dehydrogenase, partial [Salinibacter sp.]